MVENPENILQNKKIKLLEGFSDEERREFLTCGAIREFYLHDKIISENEDDAHIYLILDGDVSVWRKDVRIFKLKSGDVFNEIKIFNPKPNNITVLAESNCMIFRFTRNDVLNYFKLKPERLFKIFMLNIVTILLKKIEGYEDRLIDYNLQFRYKGL